MFKFFFKTMLPLALILVIMSSGNVMGHAVKINSKNSFAPKAGNTLLIIGQDKDSIDDYYDATGLCPAGVMVYTSIQDLNGLSSPFNNGAGVHYGNYLLNNYPDSVLQIGLYMVGALKDVNEGLYDRNIKKLAKWIKNANRPVYLRIGYEFDNKTNNYDPGEYISAYKRIVDRFKKLRVDNVAFVWHSGAFEGPEDPLKWYPGDKYVDWFAASLFAPVQYEKVKAIASYAKQENKPFMLAETTPAGTYTERAKIDWYKKFFRIIDEIKPQAVCYINVDWESRPMWKGQGWGDARIQKFPRIKDLWLNEISKDKYIHEVKF